MPTDLIRAEEHFRHFMLALGLNPEADPQLKHTPARFTKMLCRATKNYRTPPLYTESDHYDSEKEIKATLFAAEVNELVIVKDIHFSSICAHHFLPFFGTCHIGYLPSGQILGLSKFARITDFFCLRPQTQEMLTEEIAHEIRNLTSSPFVAVMMEAEHTCMSCRGPLKHGAITMTSRFITDPGYETTKAEFQRLILR